jgi:hypothetical protein
MNILGEGFPKQIIAQVDQRQKIYGSGYIANSTRNPEKIAYLNANTSWVKLVSSVNIDDPTVIQDQSLSGLGNNITSNKLATKFVLFNGVNESPSLSSNQRSGISFNNSILGGDNAYGIGGTDFGLLPMMGITSAKIKHENRGSIRRASVQIKAFNKSQFDIIDVLYLRLGFNILLEWGHSTYFDNKGDFQRNGVVNSLADEFLDPSPRNFVSLPLSYSVFLDKIQENRLNSNGNYDAMFAKVCNYHWSFLPDGSYDITLDLVSIGDIIESFKINIFTKGIDPTIQPISTPTGSFVPTKVIDLYANQSDIGRYFYDLKSTIIANPSSTVDGISKTTYDNTTAGIIWYVRLGAFLEHIEKNIMYYATPLNSTTKSPILKFDYDIASNLMYIEKEYQTSVDPSICIINRDIKDGGKTYNITRNFTNPKQGNEFNSSLLPSDPPVYGQIMNIYVSMSWILTKIDEIKDAKTNKVTLVDMLENILSGINSAFGGTTNLEATIDETTNTVIIRDMNPLPNISAVIKALNATNPALKISDKYAKFEMYGYNGASASFIKDFSLTTEISPELSTMLTVGATANSTVVGENSTALSRFNAGLTDRFKETITEPTPPPPPFNFTNFFPLSNNLQTAVNNLNLTSANAQLAADKEKQALLDKYAESFVRYLAYLEKISEPIAYFSQEETETYKNLLNDTITYQQQYRQLAYKFYSQKRNVPFSPSTGFIPFNLSLTMEGLSGMKIYSKFFINTKFLPANYPDNADFLIKNITHTIEKNKWFTNVESIVISKGETDILTHNSNIGVSNITTPPPMPSSSSATVRTLTNSFPLNKRILTGRVDGAGNPKIFKKTQIYLHHTAGFAKDDWGKQVIDIWNNIAASGAAVRPGSPYVMDRKGRVEQLADDKYYYYTQGSQFAGGAIDTNQIGIGIEVVNPGPATLVGGKWYAIRGAADLSTNNVYGLVKGINGTSPLGIGNGISYLVDENLNKITYNGNQYGVSYFPAQIIELEKLIRRLMATHNIPFTWQGKKTYDQMFPNYPAADPRYKRLDANNGVPGMYTHRCVNPKDKIDLCPNQEIIEMLKRF